MAELNKAKQLAIEVGALFDCPANIHFSEGVSPAKNRAKRPESFWRPAARVEG